MPSGRSREIRVSALTGQRPFSSGAMRGTWDGDTYRVFSYAVIIAEANRDGVITYYNPTRYSVTTSHHQSAVRQAWGITLKGAEGIDRRGGANGQS